MELEKLHFSFPVDASFGTILYIGAGTGADLEELLDLNPNKLIAVEASKMLYKTLLNKSRKYPNVTTINEWILPYERFSATAFEFNNPRYNSLANSAYIKKNLPNLKLISEMEVEGLPIDKFINNIDFDSSLLNFLVISVQGEEKTLLDGLDSSVLGSFDYIFIETPVDSSCSPQSVLPDLIYDFEIFNFCEGVSYKEFLYKKNVLASLTRIKHEEALNDLKEVVKENDLLNSKLETLKEIKDRMEMKLNSRENELAVSRKELKEKVEKIEELEENLSSSESLFVEKLKKQVKENEDLKKRLADFVKYESENKELREKNKELNFRQHNLDAELVKMEAQIKLLNDILFNNQNEE